MKYAQFYVVMVARICNMKMQVRSTVDLMKHVHLYPEKYSLT